MYIVFLLLVVFQVKHLVVDFFLQNTYMLGKFNKVGWIVPLVTHTSMHGVATLIITLMIGINPMSALILAGFDMLIHTAVDKAKVDLSRGLKPTEDKVFWWWLGGDQMMHHLTHYLLIFIICIELGYV